MAKNLRQKIPKEDTLFVQDVNSSAVNKFVDELSNHKVEVASSAREVAEMSVRPSTLHPKEKYPPTPKILNNIDGTMMNHILSHTLKLSLIVGEAIISR